MEIVAVGNQVILAEVICIIIVIVFIKLQILAVEQMVVLIQIMVMEVVMMVVGIILQILMDGPSVEILITEHITMGVVVEIPPSVIIKAIVQVVYPMELVPGKIMDIVWKVLDLFVKIN
jgi:hypothetical protein